jgi:hypothetical protein
MEAIGFRSLPGARVPASRRTHAAKAHDIADRHGIEAGAGVLFRPDGHAAWRSRGTAGEPAARSRDALARAVVDAA